MFSTSVHGLAISPNRDFEFRELTRNRRLTDILCEVVVDMTRHRGSPCPFQDHTPSPFR